MYPILFEFGGITLYSFGFLLALAFLVGMFWILHRAKAAGEDEDDYTQGVIWLLVMSLIGARLLYLIYFPDAFLADPIGVLFSQGGLVWYGGMVFFALTVIAFTRAKNISLFKFSDIVVPPAALGLAIGRIGCLMAGCCFGGPCDLPWAIHYPAGHETVPHGVHPAPLYESLGALAIVFILLNIERRQATNGFVTWWFFILYGALRFLIEYARGDRLVWWAAADLSASQLISLGGILLGIVMVFWLRRKKHAPAV